MKTATLRPKWIARDYACHLKQMLGSYPSRVVVSDRDSVLHTEDIPEGNGRPASLDIHGIPLVLPGGRRKFWPALSVWREALYGPITQRSGDDPVCSKEQ
jgi:hypothetical protein